MRPHIVPATGDPGLQPERTALAWTRTALAVAVNALLSIRAGFVSGEPWLVAVGVLLFAASGAVAAIGTVRRRQLSGERLVITPPAGALARRRDRHARSRAPAASPRCSSGASHERTAPRARARPVRRRRPHARPTSPARAAHRRARRARRARAAARALGVRRREIGGRPRLRGVRVGVRHERGGVPYDVRLLRAGRRRVGVLRDLGERRRRGCSATSGRSRRCRVRPSSTSSTSATPDVGRRPASGVARQTRRVRGTAPRCRARQPGSVGLGLGSGSASGTNTRLYLRPSGSSTVRASSCPRFTRW